MERAEQAKFWADMWSNGIWIPSLPASLAGITAEEAAWIPGDGGHSIWQEVAHVIFWWNATLNHMKGQPGPSAEEVESGEFAIPTERTQLAWDERFRHLSKLTNR